MTASFAAKPEGQAAPIHRAEKPIKDAQGRIEVIIDFDFDSENDPEFDNNITDEEAGKYNGHRPRSVKLLNKFEKKYGISRTGMTSWTTTSVTAFVTEQQLQKIAKEKRVNLVTENSFQSLSGFFLASDTITSGESVSWGQKLTTNGTVLSGTNSPRTVYVIDSGVANHDDLNVTERVNVACGTLAYTCSTASWSNPYPTNDPYPPVGCFPHATHVAGIIGARGGNGKTSVGVYPGVRIVSVSINSMVGTAQCSRHDTITTATIGYGIDWVSKHQRIRSAASGGESLVGIVNASFNSGQFGYDSNGNAEANRLKLFNLVTPALTPNSCVPSSWGRKDCVLVPQYQGAFFVQSAGNERIGARGNATGAGRDICTQFRSGNPTGPTFGSSAAYTHALPNGNTTDPSDGIMVVAAFHADGEPADSTTQRPLAPSVPAGLAADTSSNYGPCIDIWAPGSAIYSAWCDHSELNAHWCKVRPQPYSGNGMIGSSGWAVISGTSMAAPHVAGAAAYLADALGLTSPAAIELAIRARALNTGRSDRSNTPVRFLQIP